MDDIFDNLNEKQIEAVKATEGKVRVIAGAGSGKTRVLAHRFAYLVNELGIDPGNILCMTFTNKAAQEMKNRIAKLVHRSNVNDFICTIHGFCVKFLRREIHRIGYPKNFIIIDNEDAKHIALNVMNEMGLDTHTTTVNKFLQDVGNIKRFAPQDYIEKIILPDAPQLEAKQIDEFTRYIQYQLKSFALDFDDIIQFTLYIMEHYEDSLCYWQEKMNYVMVDEVQDCSRSDWQIINNLYPKYGNLFIVGDPDQCIYEWRGAQPKFIINFNPDTDIILNQNYRSTPNILDVANSIISHNENRIPKDLFTQQPSSRIVIHYHGRSEEDEANWISSQIDNLVKAGSDYSDFAILYRASYLSRNIEQALMKKQIKYAVWGGIRFFERREIKDCISYLRLIALKDDISFRRIVNTPPRKFGKVSMSKLQDFAEKEGSTLYDALCKHKDDGIFNKEAVNNFIQLIQDCTEFVKFSSVSEVLDYVLKESGLDNMYRVEGEDERLDNIAELKQSIKEYEQSNINEEVISLDTYLQDIALYTNADYKNDKATVKLMTIHQAKGLEFPYVFICGLSEGIFPSHRTIREWKKKGEEEERRLMYVAVTRAEKALFLTESAGFGTAFRDEKYPSRFLSEVKDGLLEVQGDITPEALKVLLNISGMVVDKLNNEIYPKEFGVGSWVEHKVFGKGRIIEKTIGNSYKVHFDIGDRYILSNLLVQSESPMNSSLEEDTGKETIEELIVEKSKNIKKHNRPSIAEIMKEARSGDADAIIYCAQHKINPFNFGGPFFYNYNMVKIGDWFYDDCSFSRNRSDLKNCVGVVFSLETSQLEQADGWTHGLIVAVRDAAQTNWGPYEDLSYPHTHYSTKDLEVLEKLPDSFNDYHTEYLLRNSDINAFIIAREYKLNLPKRKTSGWFLPSISQLRQIACNLSPEILSKISMNSGKFYWSSSQSNANEACTIHISLSFDGNETHYSFDTCDKDSPFKMIRPIVAF